MKQKNRDQQFLFNTKKGIVKVICFKQILPTQDKKKKKTCNTGSRETSHFKNSKTFKDSLKYVYIYILKYNFASYDKCMILTQNTFMVL